MTTQEFAQKIRIKFPSGVASDGISYAQMDDGELAKRIVAKYPVYKDQITDFAVEKTGLSADLSKRAEKGSEAILSAQRGEQSKFSAGLQVLGQGAGAVGDIAFAGLKALTPKFIEKAVGSAVGAGAKKIAETDTAQVIAEKYGQFKAQHPEAAANLEATGLLGSILPVGKGAQLLGKGAAKGGIITGKALEISGISSAVAQKKAFARELTRPVQTKAVREAEVARTTEKGLFKKDIVELTVAEKNMANAVQEIPQISSKNTYQKNYSIVQAANKVEAQNLKMAVAANDFALPRRETISRLKRAQEKLALSPTIVGDAQTTAGRLLDGAIKIVNENPSTGSGLLKAKKEYDAWVLSQKPKTFDANVDNAFTLANREVRNTFKNLLDEKAPTAGVKTSLAKQHALFDAMDNIAPKAAEEANTAIMRKFQKIGQILGTKNKIVQAIAAAAGIGGLGAAATFAPAVVLVGGAGFVLYKAGKLVLKPEVRIALGKLLQSGEKLLTPVDKAYIQGLLNEYKD